MNKITATKALKGVNFDGSSCPEYTVHIPEGLKEVPSSPQWIGGENHPNPKVACTPYGPLSPGD